MVAWTTAEKPHEITIPLDAGSWNITSYDGKKQTQMKALDGITLTIDGGPQYLKR